MSPDTLLLRERLRSTVSEVLPGTMAVLPAPADPGTGTGIATAACLALSIDRQAHSLVLHAGSELLEQAFRQWMGRAATGQELPGMATEIAAELLNQLGGRFAGELGKAGCTVELATPQAMAPNAPIPRSADGVVLAWRCGGQDSSLRLLPGTLS